MFLQAAGNAVKRASDNLVKAAQKAAFEAQDDQAVVVKSKMVGGIAQVSHRFGTQQDTSTLPKYNLYIKTYLMYIKIKSPFPCPFNIWYWSLIRYI